MWATLVDASVVVANKVYAVILLLPVSACVGGLYAVQETSVNGVQLIHLLGTHHTGA